MEKVDCVLHRRPFPYYAVCIFLCVRSSAGLAGTIHGQVMHCTNKVSLTQPTCPSAAPVYGRESQSLFYERMIGQGRPFAEVPSLSTYSQKPLDFYSAFYFSGSGRV